MLQAAPSPSGAESQTTLPMLPSEEVGRRLLEAAYLYTQARYCIVDWVKVREWHHRREEICYVGREDSIESQIGKETARRVSRYHRINKLALPRRIFYLDRLRHRSPVFC